MKALLIALLTLLMIPMTGINAAFERMEKADVKYRFVIDMASIKQT